MQGRVSEPREPTMQSQTNIDSRKLPELGAREKEGRTAL